VPDKPFL